MRMDQAPRHWQRTTIIGALGIFALAQFVPSVTEAATSPTLPGARPVIKAIEHSSIQSAIDALPPEGGMVTLPPGHFQIDEPLVIHQQHVLLKGAGGATHIENTNTDGEPTILLEPAPSPDGEEPDPQWRLQLTDFRLTGNPDSGAGIVAKRVNELFIRGVTVTQHGSDGILLDHCYENPRLANNMITYNKGTGIRLLGCHDIVVEGNQLEENQDALRCIDSYNLCMTGNNLDDHLGNGVVIENTYGSVVSGNMIEECQGTAIILDRNCYGDTVSANVIAHNGQGIDLRDAHGCSVSANTMTIMKQAALRIGPQSDRITVTGNNFSNSYIGNGDVKRQPGDLAAAGMVLEETSSLTVSGNLFSSVRPKALELRGDPSRNILFSNNALIDTSSDHDQLEDSIVDRLLTVEAPEAGDSNDR